MLQQTKIIIKKLEEWKIPIRRQYVDNTVEYICTDFMIVSCNPKDVKSIGVLFNVSSKPDDAARITLDLKSLNEVDEVFVDDVFIYVEGFENIVIGKPAMKIYDQFLRRTAVDEFVEDQEQRMILMTTEGCPEC